MNTNRFQVQPLSTAKSFQRDDIVTRPFYGTSRTQTQSPWRILLAGGFIVTLGLVIAMQMGKRQS